ncbi:DUF6338 family protein [Candidatus Poriferisodalis sp.]|uniref:DUF6338 family protein n=1 Tax=Candidatus Poriferisodalis sp. TaxID=3101277 RepID=UPI003B014282
MAELADTALVLIVLLLPGAFAAWGYERYHELYARRSKDWLLRLAAIAGMCLVVTSGPLYWLISNYGDDFRNQRSLPIWMIIVPIAYVAIPSLLGMIAGLTVGRLTRRFERFGTRFTRILASSRNAPTSWDYLFQHKNSGLVRCKLRGSDRWVGGIFGPGGYLAIVCGGTR